MQKVVVLTGTSSTGNELSSYFFSDKVGLINPKKLSKNTGILQAFSKTPVVAECLHLLEFRERFGFTPTSTT